MEEKKKLILDTAMKQFGGNGYHETTMASIAAACNISKATLYKFFPSKEELVLEAFQYLGSEIEEETAAVDADAALGSREKFIRKLEAILRITMGSMDFHHVLRHSLPGNLSEKYSMAMHKHFMDTITALREMILGCYGKRAQDISWDVTLCMMGMLHELIFINKAGKPADYTEYSIFIADCMDGIVQNRTGKQPLVDETYARFIHTHPVKEAAASLDGIKKQAAHMSGHTREKVLAASAVIEEHLNKGKAEWIIVEGMLSMLGEYPELAERVRVLRRSLDCVGH